MADAYGDMLEPHYATIERRLEDGIYDVETQKLPEEFVVLDETSPGGDDVCVALLVRVRGSELPWRWCVQLSLVGKYATVGTADERIQRWPLVEPGRDADEGRLFHRLRELGFSILTYDELREATPLRPVNWEANEVCSVYNALFTFMDPWPSYGSAAADALPVRIDAAPPGNGDVVPAESCPQGLYRSHLARPAAPCVLVHEPGRHTLPDQE
jgi:hypothetical protein